MEHVDIFAYEIGFELLVYNALFTMAGMAVLISGDKKSAKKFCR